MADTAEPVAAHTLVGLQSLVADLTTLLDKFVASDRAHGVDLELGTVLVGGSIGAKQGRAGESDLDLGIGLIATNEVDVAAHEQAAYDFGVFVHNHQSALAVAADSRVTYVDANGYEEREAHQMTQFTAENGGYSTYYDVRQRGYIGV